MGDNNLQQAALNLGMHRNNFYVMKSSSREKFDYINNLDPRDFTNAYRLYMQEMDSAKEQLIDIYYYLSDNMRISDFGKYLADRGIYKHHNVFGTTIVKRIFSSNKGFVAHRGYIMVLKILDVFGEYTELGRI